MISLNSDQKAALRFLVARVQTDEPESELAGPAGSGKTTLMRALVNELHLPDFDENNPRAGGVAVLAPTNKAAAVLRGKGFPLATTVHHATSRPVETSLGLILELEQELLAAEQAEDAAKVRSLTAKLEQALTPSFTGQDTVFCHAELLIVDEGSMLDEPLAERLRGLGVPMVVIGDPYQLPPIQGSCPFFRNLKASGTYLLTKIERQQAGSGIIDLATAIRDGRNLPTGRLDASCSVVDLADPVKQRLWPKAAAQLLGSADVAIVGSNRTRSKLNTKMRSVKHQLDDIGPQEFEPFISYTTNKMLGVAKNDTIQLRNIHEFGSDFRAVVRVPNDPTAKVNGVKELIPIYGGHFREIKADNRKGFALHRHLARSAIEADYAYALTCHRMQGSEAPNVVVFADSFVRQMGAEDKRRWLYTAVTRAQRNCALLINSPWH